MIDFHSHILPSMDDGSKSVQESLALLEMLSVQGVEIVVASPHYYADRESPQSFLERRTNAYELLKPSLRCEMPQILLGAEVRFYNGISRLSELSSLRIENTKLLLLEMPFARWTDYTLKELCELSCSNEIVVVLAHIERYLKMQDRGVFEYLREQGILMQTNAEFYSEMFSRRKALRFLKSGIIDAIGSDCHDTSVRRPRIEEAVNAIKKNCGNVFFENFADYSRNLIIKYRADQ